MKLKYKVLFLVLLIGISASAQKNHKSFKIESSTKIEQLKYNLGKDFGGRYSKSMSCYWNDTLYLCMIDYDCFENLTLFMYDVKTASYSCCNIDMKPICRSFRGNPYMIEHFATNGKDLVLCDVNDDECLWVFKKQGDTFVFDCKIPDPDYLFGKSMRFLPNGKLLGLKNYAYSRDNNPTKLSLLDMESKSVTKTINVDFPLIGFTFMSPYENLSVSDSSIMLSQRGEYRISEYDFDLNKKGDLTTTPEGWKQMPTNLSDSLMNSNPPPCKQMCRIHECIRRLFTDTIHFRRRKYLDGFLQTTNERRVSLLRCMEQRKRLMEIAIQEYLRQNKFVETPVRTFIILFSSKLYSFVYYRRANAQSENGYSRFGLAYQVGIYE